MRGCSKVLRTNSMEMNPTAMPASVTSRAALGVARRTAPAIAPPAASMIPEKEARDETNLPCHLRRLLARHAGARGPVLEGRRHHEEHEGEQADGVDAEGKGGHVLASLAPRDAARLPGIEEIADDQADRGAGEDARDDEARRKPAHPHAQVQDQEELDEIVDGQAEEPVEVPSNEQRRARGGGRSSVGILWHSCQNDEFRERRPRCAGALRGGRAGR